jgi:hypothetical protein
VLALFLAALPRSAPGDGGFVAPIDEDVWEPSQLAFLLHDDARQVEDLIVQPSFQSQSRDLAWIVPLPNVPEITTEDAHLFRECFYLTQPLRRNRGTDCGCSDNGRYMPQPTPDSGDILIYDEQVVGIYDTRTVGADSASVLADYLEAWGYLHAGNRSRVEPALQHYIAKSWCFVALRVDSSRQGLDFHEGYWTGGLDPVRFTFQASEPVYPMRISAISARDATMVLLYACGVHRMTFEGAATEYANRLTAEELPELRAAYPLLGDLIAEPCFITKLRRTFSAEAMQDDIVLTRAATDEELRRIEYTGIPVAEGVWIAIFGLGVFRIHRWHRRRRPPPDRTDHSASSSHSL